MKGLSLVNTTEHPLDSLSMSLFEHLLDELHVPIAGTQLIRIPGLPDATVDVPSANLLLSRTPIEEPFFQDTMLRVVEETARDLIVIRSGFHPETLNPLVFDVVLHTPVEPLALYDLSLFRDFDRTLHLVPQEDGPCVSLVPDKLQVASGLPFASHKARRHGRERAAAEIVRRLR